MSARYVNADTDPMRALAEAVGETLSSALDGRKADAVSLADRRKPG